MLELQQYHDHLRLHFKTLSDERESAPVFFLEHDLTDEALAELTQCLARALQTEPFLRSNFWHSRYLPMLVLASEVGYQYAGLGSGYWPAPTSVPTSPSRCSTPPSSTSTTRLRPIRPS